MLRVLNQDCPRFTDCILADRSSVLHLVIYLTNYDFANYEMKDMVLIRKQQSAKDALSKLACTNGTFPLNRISYPRSGLDGCNFKALLPDVQKRSCPKDAGR